MITTKTLCEAKWFGRDGVEYYTILPQFQVHGDFNKGDKVRVTIERLYDEV